MTGKIGKVGTSQVAVNKPPAPDKNSELQTLLVKGNLSTIPSALIGSLRGLQEVNGNSVGKVLKRFGVIITNTKEIVAYLRSNQAPRKKDKRQNQNQPITLDLCMNPVLFTELMPKRARDTYSLTEALSCIEISNSLVISDDDIEFSKWVIDELLPNLVSLKDKAKEGSLTQKDLEDWIDEIIHPKAPDFNIKGILEPDAKINWWQISILNEMIVEQVMIPKKIVLTYGDYGLVVGYVTEEFDDVITPAGRKVPTYDMKIIGSKVPVDQINDQALAKVRYTIIFDLDKQLIDYYNLAKADHLMYDHGLYEREPFKTERYSFKKWVNMHALGNLDEKQGRKRYRDMLLAEENAHADTNLFFSAVLGKEPDKDKPDEVVKAAEIILQPKEKGTSRVREILESKGSIEEKEKFAHAILEIEAKLNSLIHSPYPADNFSYFFDETPGNMKHYGEAYKILLLLLSKKVIGKETNDINEWFEYLETAADDLDTLNEKLRQAPLEIYPNEFLTLEEREKVKPGWKDFVPTYAIAA